MTVEQAKTMHDGATVSLRGNLLKRQEMTVISFVIKRHHHRYYPGRRV